MNCKVLPQSYAFRHLGTEDGMLSDLRLVMAEDRQGRLWIGSDEGINIFDGYQLTTYTQPDSVVMKTTNVQQIFCDSRGTIWIATGEGIMYKNETDSRFRKLPSGRDLLNEDPFFGETVDGHLLIAGRNHCYQLKDNMEIIKLQGLETAYSKFKYLSCFEHFKGDEWLMGFRKKLLLVNIRQQKVIKEIHTTNLWCATRVNDSTIMTGSFGNDTISLVHVLTGVVEQINNWPVSNGTTIGGYAGTIMHAGDNKFAIASRYYGVYMVDVENRNATIFEYDPADPFSIRLSNSRRLYITRNGTMFVHNRGLSYTQLSIPQFKLQKFIVDKNGNKYDGGFTSATQDRKKNYWLGTNASLALWNRQTNTCTYYPYYDIKSGPQKYKTVRAVVTDKLDRVWVGAYGGGIGMLLPNGSYEQYRKDSLHPATSLPSLDIHAIVKDQQENFIVCTDGGFVFFDPIAKKMETFFTHPKLKNNARHATFYAMADGKNNWWLAQESGLHYYDRKADSLYSIALPKNLQKMQTQVLATDSNGMVYAGGLEGLYIISPISLQIIKILGKKDGLASNNIVGLLCDKKGKMWILGNIGAAKYDPVTGMIQNFDARDGMGQSNHTLCNFYLAPDGEVFLMGLEGFNYFYPDKIMPEKKPLKVFITEVEMRDSIISMPKAISHEFEYYQNNLSFSYLAVDFKLGTSIQYRYNLKGFDTGFVYASKQRTARYTNLAAGNYTFTVEASTNGKDWYAASAPFQFSISKAFWKTWLFIILILAILAGAVFYTFYKREKKVRKEEAVKREFESKIAQVRMNLLRTQMNPHFLFNSLNSINSFILKNDRQNASGYLTKFSRLMRLILDNSRNEWVTLDSELKSIELYVQLEALRFNHSFLHQIETGPGIDAENILLPPMLIQPYIENAIWHGLMYRKEPGGLLTLSITDNNGMLEVLIKDNGVGREAATALKSKSALQQKSYGMKITAERMNNVNETYHINAKATVKDLFDNDGNAIGTEVLLTLDKIVNKE
jgi:Histidine kinase/Y_Y_Y domain